VGGKRGEGKGKEGGPVLSCARLAAGRDWEAAGAAGQGGGGDGGVLSFPVGLTLAGHSFPLSFRKGGKRGSATSFTAPRHFG